MPRMNQNAFTAGLRTDPQGSMLPRPSSCNGGLLLSGTDGRREETEREKGIPPKSRSVE